MRVVLLISAIVFGTPHSIAFAQERNLPEEVRALSVVCSAGASVSFRGEIQSGLDVLFRKILEGEAKGELDISRSEDEFLSSFEDQELRLEARKIYSDCVRDALRIVYNFGVQDLESKSGESLVLVPDPLRKVNPGQTFAVRVGEGVFFSPTGSMGITSAGPYAGAPIDNPSGYLSGERAASGKTSFDIGRPKTLPGSKCTVTLYAFRGASEKDAVYSFQYNCN